VTKDEKPLDVRVAEALGSVIALALRLGEHGS
jgi:hypothetical protein